MAYVMKHEVDARQEILKAVGDISNFNVFHNQVLIAIYIRPEMTAGGIIITNKTRDEDKWQGKVGLVLKKGPSAFVDESNQWFKNMKVEVGDWVVSRPSDGWSLTYNNRETGDEVLCRLIDDTFIRSTIPHPDSIF